MFPKNVDSSCLGFETPGKTMCQACKSELQHELLPGSLKKGQGRIKDQPDE